MLNVCAKEPVSKRFSLFKVKEGDPPEAD